MAVYAVYNALTGLTRTMLRLATVLMTPTGSVTVRSGVIPGGTGLLLTGSVMTGSVAPGKAVVQGTTAQGAYQAVVDAATAITVANGHASLTRIDTVWLVVLDHEVDASGSRQASIVYQQGTAGSGSAPAAPATGLAYLRLWDITVPANASSGTPINWGTALADKRVYTTAVGGINPGGTSVVGSYVGQYRDNTGTLERWNGSAWTVVGPVLPSAFAEDSTTRTTTSATYNTLGSTLSAAIVAPPSGKIRVALSGKVQAVGGGGNPSFLSFAASGSSSGAIFTPSDIQALGVFGANDYYMQAAVRTLTATPGETVTVTVQGRAAGGSGTCTVLYRSVHVEALSG